MYPKDRLPRSSKSQMPPNLVTLFAHVMSHANEGGRGSVAHSWDEVLQPSAASGSTSPGPFPMSAQDWRKAEAFSLHLQSLIAARHIRCTSNGNGRAGAGHSNGDAPSSSSAVEYSDAAAAAAAAAASSTQTSSLGNSSGKNVPHSNSRLKGKARSPATAHASQAVGAASVAAGAATPNPGVNWPRHHVPRVTPKEPCRAGEPSAPTKPVGRVGGSRRQSSAEGAVASLAVSRAGPGAFETPSHSSYHHTAPPGASAGDNPRGREHSPSRYPARLRSRRFPQLGGSGESPEPPQPRGFGYGAEAVGDGDHTQGGARRLSSRHYHVPLARGGGQLPGISPDHPQLDWRGAAAGEDVSSELEHSDGHREDGQSYGMRTRAAPKPATVHAPENSSIASPSGAYTPQVSTGAAPPPLMGGGAAVYSSPREEVAPPARPRQVLQGGRAGGRPTPVPRSSVGGRNYTDNHVKQLVMIEAAVVASATAKDRAMYNLPRQGRTLTLTNVFKFVALRGAGVMYSLATEKQVEAHTGRHSNFFDGKIDARIVGIIKKDIGDEAITKSRKFSKILLSLVAEGCTHSDCDWDHNSFTSDKIALMQARVEAETGTSALKHVGDPVSLSAASAAVAAAASAAPPASPLGPGVFGGAGSSGAAANGAPSKRRLDLGRDAGMTPSPRLKKLKRAARVRMTGVESTPTGDGIGNSKSPPKEEDDMRAAEVLQGLKGLGGPSG